MTENYFGQGRITNTAWPQRNEEPEGPDPVVPDKKPKNGTTQENAIPGWLPDWGYKPDGKGVEEISDETTDVEAK